MATQRTMQATVVAAPGKIALRTKSVPAPGPLDAVIRITTTTICGSDVHIVKGDLPVSPGVTIGHEPVGVIEALGDSVSGYRIGQRVIAGAVTPGLSEATLAGCGAHCGAGSLYGHKLLGGWRFGNTIDGAQAEYLLVPDAMLNLAVIPDHLTDEQVLMCPDILSTGFAGAERGDIRIGDTVAVFAQGPIGLCATAGARLMGASRIIAVEHIAERVATARKLGADHVVDFSAGDPVAAILELTGGRGVDVAIEALGTQATFEAALRVLRPGGTLSSLGVYAGDLRIPLDAYTAGLGDNKIVTTLCPGGKERMRRLMEMVAAGRVDTGCLLTHRFRLSEIEDAYDLFANRRDGVLKVAITP